jgi:RHS repeat-associated protein
MNNMESESYSYYDAEVNGIEEQNLPLLAPSGSARICREADGRFVSVRDLHNTSETVVETVSYDNFGNLLNDTNTAVDGTAQFLAQQYDCDPNVSLYDCCTRAYNPTPGRWLMADPIGFEADDANLHTYVANAPTEPSE